MLAKRKLYGCPMIFCACQPVSGAASQNCHQNDGIDTDPGGPIMAGEPINGQVSNSWEMASSQWKGKLAGFPNSDYS